jgi:hypothetical protein
MEAGAHPQFQRADTLLDWVDRMKYMANYVVTHRGNKHSGCLVLRGDGTPKIGDVLDARVVGLPLPTQIDSVNFRKET